MNKDKLFRIKDFITPISKSYHFKKSEIFPCFCMICLVSKSQGLFSCSLFPQGNSKGITKTVARAKLLFFVEGLCKTKNLFYRVKKPFNKFWLPDPVTTLQIGDLYGRGVRSYPSPLKGVKARIEAKSIYFACKTVSHVLTPHLYKSPICKVVTGPLLACPFTNRRFVLAPMGHASTNLRFVKGHRIKRFVRVWGTNPFVVRKRKKKSFISIIVPKLFWYSSVKTSYTVIRPLLYFSRFTITLTCSVFFLPVYPDLSNSKIRYSRNRIRKQIIPSIKFFFNPKVERALFQFSEFYNRDSILEKKKETF